MKNSLHVLQCARCVVSHVMYKMCYGLHCGAQKTSHCEMGTLVKLVFQKCLSLDTQRAKNFPAQEQGVQPFHCIFITVSLHLCTRITAF